MRNFKKFSLAFFIFILIFVIYSQTYLATTPIQKTNSTNIENKPLLVNNKVLYIEVDNGGVDSLLRVFQKDFELNKIFPPDKFKVVVRKGKGPDLFRNMSGYGIIIINAHGYEYDKGKENIPTKIYSGINKEDITYKEQQYINNGTCEITESGRYWIKPEFISDKSNNNNLDNSIVFLCVCYSHLNPGLATEFAKAGANVIAGFKDSVNWTGEMQKVFNDFFTKLQQGKTIKQIMQDIDNGQYYDNYGDPYKKIMSKIYSNAPCNFQVFYRSGENIENRKLSVIPSLVKPLESIECKNNTNGNIEIERKVFADAFNINEACVIDDANLDVVVYDKNNNVYTLMYNTSRWSSLIIPNGGRAIVTNKSKFDLDINPVKLSGNIDYTKDVTIKTVNTKAVKIISLKPNTNIVFSNMNSRKATLKISSGKHQKDQRSNKDSFSKRKPSGYITSVEEYIWLDKKGDQVYIKNLDSKPIDIIYSFDENLSSYCLTKN